MNTETHTDIKDNYGLIRFLPDVCKPYAYLARIDRPVGIWLLVLPGWWATLLAASTGAQALYIMTLFGIGAVIMRAVGCTINDLWDRNLDTQVARTQNRPLAAGILSPKQAFIFLTGLLCIGLIILLQFNKQTIVLGCACVPLIAAYPFMKRITWWPQAFLGITFNFGALMGWSAITNTITWPAFTLYLSCVFWTLGYDTIYAHQDKEDDALAGIKSTALKFGIHSKIWVAGFFTLSWTLLALTLLQTGHARGVIVLCLAPCHMIWQLKSWDQNMPDSALRIFQANRDYGFLVSGLLILTRIIS